MAEDVLDKLSTVIGRKVAPVAAKQPQDASASGVSALEKAIGRQVKPAQLNPLAAERYKIYTEARTKGGYDADGAMKTALSTAATAAPAPKESPVQRAENAIANVPIGPGAKKTLGDVGKDFSDVFHRAWSNPMGISDERWERDKTQVGKYLESIDQKHLGEGSVAKFATGLDKGAFTFLGEQAAPGQVALLLGTFGESALVRAAAKTGIAGAPQVAKTLAKLMQIHFTAAMIEGTATGIENTFKQGMQGDWEAAGQSAIEGLASGLMAKGAVDHEKATAKVRGDLEKVARDQYGAPAGNPVVASITSRFDQLDPYQQGLIIDQTVRNSPEYQDVLKTHDDKNAEITDETRKQQQKKLHEYYGTALSQAWDENVARRTMKNLQTGRERREVMDVQKRQEEHAAEQRRITDNLEAMQKEFEKQAAAKMRQVRRQEGAGERSAVGRVSEVLASKRDEVWKQRNAAVAEQTVDEVPQRKVEAVLGEDGSMTYPAFYWGEENSFGAAGDLAGHSIYRQTPRGTEWMDSQGNFTEAPDSLYVAPTPEMADTIARLQALGAHTSTLADQDGATPDQIADADKIANIRRELVAGTIDAKEAQRQAGIAEKSVLPDEYTAARDGRLNGPFHESSAGEYYEGLKKEAQEVGLSEEDTNALLDEAGMLSRQQTESNLNHVYRAGDYIVSKGGTKWTLDSNGILHPNDGGQPVPLMKRGLYSNDALQLAQSGRVGYGTETREERRAAQARSRATAEDIRNHQDEMDREMRLAVQREGLVTAAPDEPRADLEEKGSRQERIMSRPPRAPESEVGNIVRLIFKAPTDASSIIKAIAKRNGVTDEEVMRLQLANDPERSTTTEAQIARLEVGDRISDDFRKDRPWTVEKGKDGKTYIRSGNAQPLLLDRLNPSDRVRQLVEKGKITTDRQEFSLADAERAAFDTPHYVGYQQRLMEQVRDRAEGKVVDPAPRNEGQAIAQAEASDRRSVAAEAVATRATVDALEPPIGSTVDQATAEVDKAVEQVKLAEAAYAQAVDAISKTATQEPFPPKAPATIGYKGSEGTITQNGREIPFHYELLPLEGLETSHRWEGGQMVVNDDYPSSLQPRTISEEESRQNALRAERRGVSENGRTSGYNFSEYADKTINGSMGPAIVEPYGRVVGGNTRIALMRRHLENLRAISDPEEREAAMLGFRVAMRRLAGDNGIAGYPNDGTFHVVVRMMDKPIADTREAAELGRLFNKSVSVQITKSAKGVSYSKSLDEPLLGEIARRVDVEDGIAAAIAADPEYFRNIVTERFDVDPAEYADWFNDIPGRGLQLSEEGREQFTKALLGTVVKDTSILNRIQGKTPYRALERALGYVVQLRAFPDRNITGKIVEALQAAADTQGVDPALSRTNDRWLATYHPDQIQLAGMEVGLPPEPDRIVEALWRSLHASDAAIPRAFNDRLKNFIGEESSKASNLFGAHHETPAEAFNRAFRRELAEVQYSRRDSEEGVTQEEFDQALRNVELGDVERSDTRGGRGESPEQAKGAQAPEGLYVGQSEDGRWHVKDGEKFIKMADSKEDGEAKLAQMKAVREKYHSAWKEGRSVAPGKMEPPPKPPTAETVAARDLAIEKTQTGYVTPAKLQEFLASHPATRENVPELMRTARMMADYVFDIDPPVGVDRKESLDWVLRERLAGIEAGDLTNKRGQYSDPNIEKRFGDRIMKLHKAADPSTFIHEFAHVIFPMLSDEDMAMLDTIGKDRVWKGSRKSLEGRDYADLSEKFSNGLERFLRDQNPTGFTAEVKAVLAKIKDVMKKVYAKFAGDPLSPFGNTGESREVFSKMFGITDFDLPDDWAKEVRKARAEEKRMKRPDEEGHPIQKLATESGATGIKNTLAGKVTDSVGSRVDPRQPTVVLVYPNEDKAAFFWTQLAAGESKIDSGELIEGDDGNWGVRFNTKTKVPANVLFQDVPKRHPGLDLEDAKKRLAATSESAPMVRKLLQVKIQNLENEIRSKYGAEEAKPQSAGEVAKQAIQEVKSGARDGVRKAADGIARDDQRGRVAEIPKPSNVAKVGHEGAGVRGSVPVRRPVAGAGPRSLADVKGVGLEPLAKERGVAVGTVVGEPFDREAWQSKLRTAGLPESLPAPTWALDRKTADKLIFPGQPQVVQTSLSALEQGDGAVIATATGTGKGYTSMAIAKEWRAKYPDAKILLITKNQSLLKTSQGIAENTFGFDVNMDLPDKDAATGTYGKTFAGIIRDDSTVNTNWDLVLVDESGEARNWFKDDNKQGKKLMAITANAKKAVYFSATPFHSPMEYGYLTKLNLWPKNGFDKWIENNFAHEKIDDKVVARLDPAKQAKLRQQLIERGQLVSQAISYEGFTAHFGVVPVTDQMKRGLDRIHEGFARAKAQLVQMKKKGLAEKIAAFEATYTKAFLERERIPQAIEIAKKARESGWQVAIFSETSSEDLFRREVGPNDELSTYQELDQAMGGGLSKIIPPFGNVYDLLQSEFAEDIGDYSGRGNSMGERDKAKADFLSGERPMLYSTYAAGGIGVSLHDADFPEMGIKGGDKPRVAIYLGPPYSGVLLEQSMGRFWRFGVKSDVHSVFLATDSEPDVRLMQQKVGPRMRALRASVLGERDSLASAMASYTNEDKVRARQESLAYQEGNEVEVNATNFQVRSKGRDVGINDWSQISFPPADTAKNKGMKYGEHVAGGDWSTLYQAKFGSLVLPDSREDIAGKSTVDAIGNGLASGSALPAGVSVQNLDPADRDIVTGMSSAAATDAVDTPVQRDKSATARQSMQAQLNLPGDKNKWVLEFPKGRKSGLWRYTGDPIDLTPTTDRDAGENSGNPKDIRTWYLANMFSQEIGIRSIAKQAGALEAGEDIVRMNRSYQADADTHFASFAMEAQDIMEEQKLDTNDKQTMAELWDAVEGKRVPGNPAIVIAAEKIATLHERVHGEEANADVKLRTPAGATMSWKEILKDRNYMPHRIDWNAELQDPLTGETHKLKDVMKETFAEASRRRIIEAIAKEKGYTYDQVVDYLKAYSPNTPVLGHINRARTLNFPFIKKDWKTLMGYYRQASDAIAVERNFGSDRAKLDKEIARIPSENGRRTIKSMFDGLLQPQEWEDWTAKVYNAAIAFEAGSKMTLSVTKVPFHLVHVPVGLRGRVRPMVRAMLKTALHPREVFENASYVGTIARQLNAADVISGEDSQGITHQIFGKTGFNAAYKLVRAISGESARVWMEQYAMHELKKGNPTEARRLLKDVMLIGDQGIDEAIANGRFSPEDLAKGQTAFANLTTWSNNPLQMPGWARLHIEKNESTMTVGLKRAVRLSYALQSFSLKSTSLLREQLYDEVVHHGNLKPLAYAIVAYPIIGQLLAGTAAAAKGFVHRGVEGLSGKKDHREDSWDKFMANLKDAALHPEAAKFLKLYLDGITLGVGWDRTRRIMDPFLNMARGKNAEARSEFRYMWEDELNQDIGPAWNEIVEVIKLGANIGDIETAEKHPEKRPEKVKEAVKKYATEELPILKQVPAFNRPPKPPKTTRPHY